MRGKRLLNQIKFSLINDPYKRGDYLRDNQVFHSVGCSVCFQPRKIPLYGELISLGDNVVIGSGVSLITHDGYSSVCNRAYPETRIYERVGCIRIGNNCFIGANAMITYDVCIGNDVVVAAGAIVTKDIPSGEVWGGVPAKCIGKTEELREKYKKNTSVHVAKEKIAKDDVDRLWEKFTKREGNSK